MSKISISIFGSTGSVGSTALNIVRNNLDLFDVKILTANESVDELILLANEFNPEAICFTRKSDLKKVKNKINSKKINLYFGPEGLIQCAKLKTDIVIAGIVGLAGLNPLIESIKNSKKVCIANKECFVSAGALVMNEAKKYNTKMV